MIKRDLQMLAVGTLIGVGLGILLAPKSGRETRKELNEKHQKIKNKVNKEATLKG